MTSRITTTLWFDGRVEEAAELCTSLFPESRVVRLTRYPQGALAPPAGC